MDPVRSPSRPPGGAFAVLRHRAFLYIWLASMLSNVGNWMETVAQAWLVQQQSGSPFLVELLAAAEFVPVALLALPAGALADRLDRRKLLLFGQTAMMVLAAVQALVAHLRLATPPVVITLAFLEGAAWASVMPAWQALVPALVPREELPSAIALNSAQFNHLIPLSMLGFALCGILYAASSNVALSGLALAVGGVFWVWSLAASNTAMQLLVPDRLRGRAMSVLALANTGALPLGHLLGGALAHGLGARGATLLTSGGLACFAVWSAMVREPAIDAMEIPVPPARRGLREAVWEAFTAASHRAQQVDASVPRGGAEPVED